MRQRSSSANLPSAARSGSTCSTASPSQRPFPTVSHTGPSYHSKPRAMDVDATDGLPGNTERAPPRDRAKLTAPGRCGMPLRRMRSACGVAVAMVVLTMPLVGGCRRGDTSSTEPSRGETAAHGGTVIASYQGRTLTSDDVTREFERLPAPSRTYLAAPDRKRQFVENLVMNDLLYEEGQKQGYDKDPEIDHQVTDLRKRLVVQRVMRQYQTPPNVSDDQVRAYYDKNIALYSTTQSEE